MPANGPADRPRPSGHDAEHLLLTIADHLHDHCDCAGMPRTCRACDMRAALMGVRDNLLIWRAAGRRLALEREDALDNGAGFIDRSRTTCDRCAVLLAVVVAARGSQPGPSSRARRGGAARSARPGPHTGDDAG